MNEAERAPFLAALDQALCPLDFKRRKRWLEWSKRTDTASSIWIHLNFGLGVINPSLGVRFTDLPAALPSDAGAVVASFQMLSCLSGVQYSSDTQPSILVHDVLLHGLPELTALQERTEIIRRLESPASGSWPVASASHRMRLLPLLLASQGRVQDSLEWLARFEQMPDQIVPGYSVFAQHFRSKYGA